MELSVIICDDLPEERSRFRRFVQAYGRERGYTVRLEETSSGSELLSRWQSGRWDLVLLDIYMPGLSGVDTAYRLREVDRTCEIVFLTTSQAHGMVGYDLRILDYLVKPADQESMFDMLDWCVQRQWERLRMLTIRSEREEMEVRLQEIRCIEVQRHTACINLEKKVLCTRRGIAELDRRSTAPSSCGATGVFWSIWTM